MKRANLLMIIGAVLLVVGVAFVAALGRDGGGSDDGAEPRVQVLVARADLAVGESGDDAVAAGKVSVEEVEAADVADGALRSPTALAGTIVGVPVAEGDQVLGTDVRSALLRSGSIDIPEGKQAIALTAAFTAAGGGYAGPGDHVNVYVNVPPGTPGAPRAPYTGLLLSDVEVLDVSEEVAPQRALPASTEETAAAGTSTRVTGTSITLLLALDATQAEQAIFASSQNELWFTLLPDGQGPSSTDGVDYGQHYLFGSNP